MKGSYSDIASFPEEQIRDVFIEVYMFCEEKDVERKFGEYTPITRWLEDKEKAFKAMGLNEHGLAFLEYESSVLNAVGINELKNSDYPIIELNQYKSSLTRDILKEGYRETHYLYTDSWKTKRYTGRRVDKLNEKYNHPFVYLWEGPQEINYNMFMDAERPELVFEADAFTADRYLTLLAQERMSRLVNQIIEEEGGSAFIGQYTAPRKGLENDTNPNEVSCNVDEIVDDLDFVKDIYPGDYDVNLIYLKEEGDDLDYEIIYRISNRIKKLFERSDRTNLFCHFYNLDNGSNSVVLSLLKNDTKTSNYFEDSGGIEDIFANMYMTREETDAFHYLDVFATKEEYLVRVSSIPENLKRSKGFDEVETMKRYLNKGIFGGNYNE